MNDDRLTTWLRAVFDEIEQDAPDVHEYCAAATGTGDWLRGECDCGWPAAVLTDIAAKRRLLEAALSWSDDHLTVDDYWYSCPKSPHGPDGVGDGCTCWVEPTQRMVLRLLAEACATRPGFREEWRS